MEGERAQLHKARMDEAAAASKVDKTAGPQTEALEVGREALTKLRASEAADPGILQALEAAPVEASKAVQEKPMDVDAGGFKAAVAAAPAQGASGGQGGGTGQQVPRVPGPTRPEPSQAALVAMVEFLAGLDGAEPSDEKAMEDKLLQDLRRCREIRPKPC